MRVTPSALALAAILMLSSGAAAQTPATPGVSPGRPDQGPPNQPERGQPAPRPLAGRGRTALPQIAPFTLSGVTVEGSSLSAEALEAAWRPFVGRTLDGPALVQLTDALSAVYADHDIAIYTLVIPKQGFEDGRVRIRALEGHVEALEIAGAGGRRDRGLVDRYAARLTGERPLRRSSLERYASLIRDIPGLNAELDLRNGRTDDGVVLVVAEAPDPVQVGLSINNRGTAFLGRTQMQADLYLNGLLRQGDRTRLTVAAPTDLDRFQAYAVQHSQPLGSEGLTLTGNVGYVRTRPQGLPILGHATSAGLQLSYPLLRGYSRDSYLTVGVDGVDADNAFLGFTLSDERTRALRVAASYSDRSPRRLLYGSLALSQGIEAMGSRDTPGVSEADFRKLNARLGVNVALGQRWAIRLAGAAQLTGDRLPATEQFALGGEEFGRGYGAATVAGDYGYGASAELAWQPPGLPRMLAGSEAYGFADGGEVWYRGRLGVATGRADVRSVGLGVRASVGGRAILQLEAAKPLPNDIPLLDDRSWRGVFAIKTLF